MKLVKEYDESRGRREEAQLKRVLSTNYSSYATRSHDEYATATLSLIKSHRNWNSNARGIQEVISPLLNTWAFIRYLNKTFHRREWS